MRGNVEVLRMIYEYYGHWLWIAVLCLSICYVFVIAHKKTRIILIISSIMFCLFILNPLIIKYLESYEQSVFYRFLWIISLPILFSFSYLKLISRYKRPLVIFLPIMAVFLIGIVSGKNAFSNGKTTFVNQYNIDDEVIAVSDIIDEYDFGDKVYVIMSAQAQLQMRIYNPRIVSAITRQSFLKNDSNKLENVKYKALIDLVNLQYGQYSAKKMAHYIRDSKAKFIVLPINFDREYMASVGCSLIAQTTYCDVYMVGIDYEFNERGKVIRRSYMNGIWCETEDEIGYSTIEYTYDDRDAIIEKRYLDIKGKLTGNKSGYAIIKYEYDDLGNKTKRRYFDPKGNLVKTVEYE